MSGQLRPFSPYSNTYLIVIVPQRSGNEKKKDLKDGWFYVHVSMGTREVDWIWFSVCAENDF